MENKNQIPSEPCQICGDIGFESSIMTCFNCREAREHIYCARTRLKSVPYMWLCEVCRSSSLVLLLPNRVNNNTKASETNKTDDHCTVTPELSSNVEEKISMPSQKTLNGCLKLKLGKRDSLVSSDTSPGERQLSPCLTFPKKPRTACSRRC